MTAHKIEVTAQDGHIWWCRSQPYSRVEIACDAIVHSIGIAVAAVLGSVLVLTGWRLVPAYAPAISSMSPRS